MSKNRSRAKRPQVPPSQTPPFIYQPGMTIAEGKSSETPCAKEVNLPERHLGVAVLVAPGSERGHELLAAGVEFVFRDILGGHEKHAAGLMIDELTGPAGGVGG